MNIEQNLIISILKLTKNGPVLTELVKTDSHLPSEATTKLLEKLQNDGLIYLEQGMVKSESQSRLKLAIRAIATGADVEKVSNSLCWQEFEEITGLVLRKTGYDVSNNLRFKQSGRRWEIDIVGCKKPTIICIDCKHWQHSIAPSALRRIVDKQVQRTAALAQSLPNPSLKLECTLWSNARFLPAVLSLMPNSFKFYQNVPVVPILQLRDFLNQLPACTDELRFIPRKFNTL